MKKLTIFAAMSIATISLSTQAYADLAKDQKQCEGTAAQGFTPDNIIAGCKAVIDDGTGGPGVLSGAYYNRGNAYYDQKDFAHAIADYDHAILLRPHYPTALFNRGLAKKHSGDSAGGDADIAASKAMGN